MKMTSVKKAPESLSDHLDLWGFLDLGLSEFEEIDFESAGLVEDSAIVQYKDGSVGLSFSVKPVDVESKNNDELNALSTEIKNLLNSLSNRLYLSFSMKTLQGEGQQLLKRHFLDSQSELPEFSKKLSKLRSDAISEKYFESREFSLECRLKFQDPSKKEQSKALNPFSKTREIKEFSEELVRLQLIDLLSQCSELKGNLENLGLEIRVKTQDEYFSELFSFFNPDYKLEDIEKRNYNPAHLSSDLFFSDLSVSKKGLSIGNSHYRVLSLKNYPEQTWPAMMRLLDRLPVDSELRLGLNLPRQEKEISLLKSQRRMAFSVVVGQKGVSHLEGEAKLQDIGDMLESLIAGGEKVFRASVHVLLRSTDEALLDLSVREVEHLFRELSSSELFCETHAAFPLFCELAPSQVFSKTRVKRIKSSNLADLLPVVSCWKGHLDEPTVLLQNRKLELIGFSPFHSSLSNANQLVSGGSGAGKSFLCNLMLTQFDVHEPQVFIIDIGGSYKKLCECMGGEYLPIHLKSQYGVNPFSKSIFLEGGEIDFKRVKFLGNLVELMTKEGEKALPRVERALLEAAIIEVFEDEKKKRPSISSLQEKLSSHADPLMRRLSVILSMWKKGSAYGALVDSDETQVDLKNNRLLCFDLKGLEDSPDLQKVFLYIITDLVWEQMMKNPAQKKFVIFDEAWKLLNDKMGADFVEESFRTLRKMNGSAIAISQSMDDFASSQIASAVLPNSSVKWILKQSGSDFKKIASALELNDREVSLIQSLKQKRGEYSEAFLMCGESRSVLSVVFTPLEYWIATTDPMDLEEFENEKRNFQTEEGSESICQNKYLEILLSLSKKFPKGVRGA